MEKMSLKSFIFIFRRSTMHPVTSACTSCSWIKKGTILVEQRNLLQRLKSRLLSNFKHPEQNSNDHPFTTFWLAFIISKKVLSLLLLLADSCLYSHTRNFTFNSWLLNVPLKIKMKFHGVKQWLQTKHCSMYCFRSPVHKIAIKLWSSSKEVFVCTLMNCCLGLQL